MDLKNIEFKPEELIIQKEIFDVELLKIGDLLEIQLDDFSKDYAIVMGKTEEHLIVSIPVRYKTGVEIIHLELEDFKNYKNIKVLNRIEDLPEENPDTEEPNTEGPDVENTEEQPIE